MTPEEKIQAGYKKKSMALFYHNGEIWFEHLDSLGPRKDYVIDKFKQDLAMLKRPSGSAYIGINLDETEVDEEILSLILYTLRDLDKVFRKVVFVGLDKACKKILRNLEKTSQIPIPFALICIDDFEKAKEWLIP